MKDEFQNAHFRTLNVTAGLIADLSSDPHPTRFYVIGPSEEPVLLSGGATHFGFIESGYVQMTRHNSLSRITGILSAGMYFACPGECRLDMRDEARGVVISRRDDFGHFLSGGPLVHGPGEFSYIDGGSTTLLIPPARRGAPCLNYLHFPPGHRQSRHSHPSWRFTFVHRGLGGCIVPLNDDCLGSDVEIALRPGSMFVIPAGGLHSINAVGSEPLEIVTFHPDTMIGWTDDWHPMLESTAIANADIVMA